MKNKISKIIYISFGFLLLTTFSMKSMNTSTSTSTQQEKDHEQDQKKALLVDYMKLRPAILDMFTSQANVTDFKKQFGIEGERFFVTASAAGDNEILDLMFAKGFNNFEITDDEGNSALDRTIDAGNYTTFKKILHYAGQFSKIEDLMRHTNNKGTISLMHAITFSLDESKSLPFIRDLLAAGASKTINHQNNDSFTALMFAIMANHPNVVHLLLQHGADINIKTANEIDSLEMASQLLPLMLKTSPHDANVTKTNHATILRLLLRKRQAQQPEEVLKSLRKVFARPEINVDVPLPGSTDGYTLLMAIAQNGELDLLHKAIAKSKNIDVQDAYGNTALTRAIRQGQIAAARKLIEAKANMHIRNRNNETLLAIAKEAHSKNPVVLHQFLTLLSPAPVKQQQNGHVKLPEKKKQKSPKVEAKKEPTAPKEMPKDTQNQKQNGNISKLLHLDAELTREEPQVEPKESPKVTDAEQHISNGVATNAHSVPLTQDEIAALQRKNAAVRAHLEQLDAFAQQMEEATAQLSAEAHRTAPHTARLPRIDLGLDYHNYLYECFRDNRCPLTNLRKWWYVDRHAKKAQKQAA